MKTITSIRVATAALILAGALSPVALASGEPKNEWPFTRPVGDRTPAQVHVSQSAATRGAGEPKNQWPFTRPVAGVAGFTVAGEPKNSLPFTQPVASPTTIARPGGFDWGDAAIGVGAGLGLAALLAGGLVLTHRGQRGREIGAAATR
jgi:hypothetical protein